MNKLGHRLKEHNLIPYLQILVSQFTPPLIRNPPFIRFSEIISHPLLLSLLSTDDYIIILRYTQLPYDLKNPETVLRLAKFLRFSLNSDYLITSTYTETVKASRDLQITNPTFLGVGYILGQCISYCNSCQFGLFDNVLCRTNLSIRRTLQEK